METYTFLRQLADSWVLLAMTLFFISVVLWDAAAQRQGGTRGHLAHSAFATKMRPKRPDVRAVARTAPNAAR